MTRRLTGFPMKTGQLISAHHRAADLYPLPEPVSSVKILQRYVLRELIGPIVISILFFSFLMMLRQLFRYAELLLEAGVGIGIFLEFLGIISVTLIIITIPMAALLGSLLGIGRLTAENEILAMRVAGISLPRIFMPVFILAGVGSVLLMVSGFDLLPNMWKRLLSKEERIQFEILTNLEPGRPYELETDGADLSLFYEEKVPARSTDGPFTLRMEQVALRLKGGTEDIAGTNIALAEDEGEQYLADGSSMERRSEMLIFADGGLIQGNLESREVKLELEGGIVFPLSVTEIKYPDDSKDWKINDMESETHLRFSSMIRYIRPEVDEGDLEEGDPRLLTLSELRETVKQLPEGSINSQDKGERRQWERHLATRNELYRRLTLPWSLLAFVLIAIPLAVELRPRAKSLAFILALFLLILYYVMLTLAGAIGMANSPYTFLAFMSPNLLIGGVGILLFWRVLR